MMTPRSSCPGGEATPLRGANLRLIYGINNVTEIAIGISRTSPWLARLALSYNPPGSFWKAQAVCGVQEYAESRRRGFGSREQVQYLGEGSG